MEVLLGIAVFKLAFNHIGLTAQWLLRSRTAPWLKVIGERTLTYRLFLGA